MSLPDWIKQMTGYESLTEAERDPRYQRWLFCHRLGKTVESLAFAATAAGIPCTLLLVALTFAAPEGLKWQTTRAALLTTGLAGCGLATMAAQNRKV